MKELPFVNDQPLKSENHLAIQYGVVLAAGEEYQKIYYSDNINYQMHKSAEWIKYVENNTLFGDNPLIITKLIPGVDRSSKTDINEKYKLFIKRVQGAIEEGLYLSDMYDEFYIPHKPCYQYCHFEHDYLITGYDDAGVFLWGYTDKRAFEKIHVSYRDYFDAVYHDVFRENLYVWSIDKNYPVTFEINEVRNHIEKFLSGSDAFEDKDFVYGKDVIPYYVHVVTNGTAEVNIRILRLFRDHKELMLHRLHYISEHYGYDFSEEYEELQRIVESANIVLMGALKQNILGRNGLSDTGVSRLLQLSEDEEHCYRKLIRKLI